MDGLMIKLCRRHECKAVPSRHSKQHSERRRCIIMKSGRAAEWLIALEFQTARLLFSLTVSFGLEDWSAMSLQCHET